MKYKVIIQAHASTDENEIIGVKEQITAALEHFGCTVYQCNAVGSGRMTETEIMKALECCKMPVGSGACNHCPLKETREKRVSNEDKSCTTIALENALDLLNHKNAEIAEKDAEIEGLKVKIEILTGWERLMKAESHAPIIKKARAEAIKEFAERVKAHSRYPNGTIYVEYIDQIAKEMGVEL